MTTSDPTPPRRTLTHTLRSRGAAPETLKPPNAVFTGNRHLQVRRVIIFAAFVTAYFLSQFLRQANAVIATDIVSEFGLTAGQLGLMTSLFYLAFAAVQLPLGGLLDHHGPRAVTPLIMLIAVPGCLLFASAQNFPALSAGRALVGLGMSGVLMGAYVAFGAWFPTERFSTLAGLMMGLGSLGGLGAAAPLAWLNDAVGWRTVFYVAAGLVLLSAGAVAIWARDPHRRPTQTKPHEAKPQVDTTPPDTPMQPSHTPNHPSNLGTVLRSGDFWRIALMFFWMPGIMLAIQGLWAGPFLHDVLGLSSLRIGAHLMLIPIGAVLGNLVSGFLGDRLGPGRVVYVAAACFFATQIGFMGVTLWPQEAAVPVIYFMFGYTAGHQVLLLAHARQVFPYNVIGRALTAVNMFGFLGATALQWSMGSVIGSFARNTAGNYPPEAYLAAFGVAAGGLILTLLWYTPLAWAPRTQPPTPRPTS